MRPLNNLHVQKFLPHRLMWSPAKQSFLGHTAETPTSKNTALLIPLNAVGILFLFLSKSVQLLKDKTLFHAIDKFDKYLFRKYL